MISCIVIEDELPAQKVLINYIGNVPDLKLKGVFKSALEVSKMLTETKIGLLFLDINLPILSGIGFLKTLHHIPPVIITSSYPDYALEGYDLNVRDYLLKPFSFERFLKAVNRIKEGQSFYPKENREIKAHQTLFINADKTLYAIKKDDILFIESIGNYIKITTTDNRISFIDSLKTWEEKLTESGFARTHKSFIINLNRIEKVIGNTISIGGNKVPIGRLYRNSFLTKLRTYENINPD